MNWNNKFWTIAGVVISLLSLVGMGITLYVNRHKSTVLEVKLISDLELTRPLNVAHISSVYLYDDSIPVEHLWQSSYVITNMGETTIYGTGFDAKNIKGDALFFQLSNCERILSIEAIDNSADISIIGNNMLRFSQWRPNEYIELRILSDGPNAPELLINDRDIQEGKIVYTKYSPEEKPVVKRLVDYLPKSLYKALWWGVTMFELLLLLILIVTGTSSVIQTKDKVTKISTAIVWIVILILMFSPLLWMF